MSAPAVSVLLPVRNAAPTLEVAVHSILGQSLAELELVAVDDGSTDRTGALLQGLARTDRRVRVLTTPGIGLVSALKVGLSYCRSEFIARMDADDEAGPTRLARSLEVLRADPSLAGVGTQVEIFRDDQPVSPNMQLYARWLNALTSPEALFRERFVESPLCHPSVTLRRAALDAVGGWEDGDFPEDYQLWLKLLEAGWRLRCVPEILLRWRDHDARLTRRDPRYGEAPFIALKARFLARSIGARTCRIWGAGRVGLALMRALRPEGVETVAIYDLDPRKVGQRIDGVPVLHWTELSTPALPHLIAAVGAKGAREEIRAALTERGWVEGRDYTCAA